jgi:hypothetical protein
MGCGVSVGHDLNFETKLAHASTRCLNPPKRSCRAALGRDRDRGCVSFRELEQKETELTKRWITGFA